MGIGSGADHGSERQMSVVGIFPHRIQHVHDRISHTVPDGDTRPFNVAHEVAGAEPPSEQKSGAIEQRRNKAQIKRIGMIQGHAHIAHIMFPVVEDGGGNDPHVKHLFPRHLDSLGGSGGPRSENDDTGIFRIQRCGNEILMDICIQHFLKGGHLQGMIFGLTFSCQHILRVN